eukprot:g16863.t1
MESNRKIPALKLFISQLDRARQPTVVADVMSGVDTNLVGLKLLGVDFTRVWLQGIVVEVDTLTRSFVVDDGTGTVTAVLHSVGLDDGASATTDAINSDDADTDGLPRKGQHLLLVGAVEAPSAGRQGQHLRSSCGRYRLLCDVMKDLGAESPNRETLWGLEVADFWRSRSQSFQG